MVAPRANALGDYLRARREQLRPDDVGLVAGARRRVPGLRREEVATLAGISSAYYLRLEQGRDTCPSAQVVEALALTLRLDRKSTEYLHRLARSTGSRPPQSTVQAVTQRLRQLIDQVPFPAIVCNRYLDVLAANPCALAFLPGAAPGQNRMCSLFLDPAARTVFVNWDEVADLAVCEFREAAGDLDDPRLRALFDELLQDAAASFVRKSRPRSTPSWPTTARCSSSPAATTTPCRWRSPRRCSASTPRPVGYRAAPITLLSDTDLLESIPWSCCVVTSR